jgi:hypothetical protein
VFHRWPVSTKGRSSKSRSVRKHVDVQFLHTNSRIERRISGGVKRLSRSRVQN